MDRSILILKRQGLGQWLLPSLKSYRAPLLVAIAYFLGAQTAFSIGTLSDRIFAPFWPPNVILLCVLLFVPTHQWWLYIAAAFPAHALAEITVGMPAAQSMVAFVTNCMVATISAFGIRRFLKEAPWFGTFQNAAIYVVIAVAISPAISALGGAFVQILGGGAVANYWTYWGSWYIANALGSITLGPVFLIWFSPRMERSLFTSGRKTELVILTISLIAACVIAFHMGGDTVSHEFLPALLYLPLPFILWAAIRFGERGASGAILVVTVVAIWQNLREPTVFIGIDPSRSVLALQIFLLGIAIPVFLLGTAIDELRRSGEATRRLAHALLRAQDEERRRIAQELHDSTGQNLVLANLMADRVQSLVPAPCVPVVGELKDILQGAMMEIRTVSYLLHPPLLDIGGLSVALRSYVHDLSKRTALSVDLEVSQNVGRMTPDVELALFRVIQEALTNIWRHSGSRTARIQLVRHVLDDRRHQITLNIEDAGRGIPDDIRVSTLSKNRQQTLSGLGLLGMRERLHQIGGRLEIDSTTGKTVIRAIVKLNKETEPATGDADSNARPDFTASV